MLRLYLAAVGLLLVSLFTGCTYVEHHHHYVKQEPEPIPYGQIHWYPWYPADVPMPNILYNVPEYLPCEGSMSGWSACR